MNIIELAHRICWRYKHSNDPAHSSTYTFNDKTLEQFAALVRAEREWVDITDDEILMCVKSQSIIETVRRSIHAFKEKQK